MLGIGIASFFTGLMGVFGVCVGLLLLLWAGSLQRVNDEFSVFLMIAQVVGVAMMIASASAFFHGHNVLGILSKATIC